MNANPFRHRDDGLQRVSVITRWVAGASAAAAALFSIAAAHPKLSVPKLDGSAPTASGVSNGSADGNASDGSGTTDYSSGANGYADPSTASANNDLTSPPVPPVRSRSRAQATSGSS